MYTAKIKTASGELLTLTGKESIYQITKITGLNPPKAQINTSPIVGLDGAIFNSSKLGMRNIVITIKINGNIEYNRQQLYYYFRTKEKCTFYYTNASLDVSIEGYVESLECDLFTKKETAQISIICPQPYFKSIEEIVEDFSQIVPLFTFPFTINESEPVVISEFTAEGINVFNPSESETGAIIEINVLNTVSKIELKNTTTNEDFILEYSFVNGDSIHINTNKGQKSVILIREGVVSNIFGALKQGSVFFQLHSGNNFFEYKIDNSLSADAIFDINIVFKYYTVYRGV